MKNNIAYMTHLKNLLYLLWYDQRAIVWVFEKSVIFFSRIWIKSRPWFNSEQSKMKNLCFAQNALNTCSLHRNASSYYFLIHSLFTECSRIFTYSPIANIPKIIITFSSMYSYEDYFLAFTFQFEEIVLFYGVSNEKQD